jgi:hypothetical protein
MGKNNSLRFDESTERRRGPLSRMQMGRFDHREPEDASMSKYQESAATGHWNRMLKTSVVCALLALGTAAPQAYSQVRVNIGIGIPIAPPPPRVEVVPMAPAPGNVWVPGYWAWHEGRHIWVHGRWIVGRPGQRYVAEHWEQRGPNHFFVPGRWEHEARGRDRDERGRGREREEHEGGRR